MSFVQRIMQNNEVSDVFRFGAHFRVVLPYRALFDAEIREHKQQPHNAILNKMDAGGLQRLNEATRQAYGYAVFIPVLLSLTRCEANRAWIDQRFLGDVAE